MIRLNEVSFEQGTIFFAYDNDQQWPANGGLRVLCYESEDTAKKEAIDLAKIMCKKHGNYQTGFQGGKIVAAVDNINDKSLIRIAEIVASELNQMEGDFITGCDLNFGEEHAEFLAQKTDHVLAGLTSDVHYASATAAGVVGAIKAALKLIDIDTENGQTPRILVHGAGAVGSRTASQLAAEGFEVMAYDTVAEKASLAGCTNISRAEHWYTMPHDILVMASISRVIDGEILASLDAKAIVCAANLAFSDDDVLQDARNQCLVIDESIASAGAVIADSIEYYAREVWDNCDADSVYTFIENLVHQKAESQQNNLKTPMHVAGIQFADHLSQQRQ